MSSNPQFSRVLKRKEVLALAFGAMIGWGWVVLTGNWIQSAGSLGAALAFAIVGFVVILIGLTYAELASAMPLAGGEFFYVYRGLGVTLSFISTWAVAGGYIGVVAFESVAMPTVIEYLFPNYKQIYLWTIAGSDVYLTWALVGIIGSVVMAVINYVGIKTAAAFQNVATLLILIVGVIFIAGTSVAGDISTMDPWFIGFPVGLLTVIMMAPFMFVGFDVIPQAAEEINLPFKEIGTVLIVSVFMAVAWYVLIIIGVAMVMTPQQMNESSLVTADAMAKAFGGAWAGKLLVLGGVAGIVTSWNAFYIGGSRLIFAMARAKMLPEFLGRLHPRYHTPHNAVILIGVLSALAPLLGRASMVWLVNAGGFGIVIAYGMVAISFLLLRRREPDMPRPFKVTFHRFVGYGAAIGSFTICLFFLPFSPSALSWPWEWMIVFLWIILGLLLYVPSYFQHGTGAMAEVLDRELRGTSRELHPK